MTIDIATQTSTITAYVVKNFNLEDTVAYAEAVAAANGFILDNLVFGFEKVMDLEGIYLARIEALSPVWRQESFDQCPE